MSDKELRELDCWLAEHVFGWKWWQFRRSEQEWCELIHTLSTWPETHKQYGGKVVIAKPVGLEDESRPTYYTTDHAAAMEVLEKCIEKTPHTICSGKLTFPNRFVVFLGGTYEHTKQEASTLPLAICLFAKKLFEKGPR